MLTRTYTSYSWHTPSTVTPVTPTAEPATTIGPKGKESGKPTFKEGDSRVPMNDDVPATFDDGSTTKHLFQALVLTQ